jgi:hypothetical protein
LGGWNYFFTLDWDFSLEDYAGWDAEKGRYILGVLIMPSSEVLWSKTPRSRLFLLKLRREFYTKLMGFSPTETLPLVMSRPSRHSTY